MNKMFIYVLKVLWFKSIQVLSDIFICFHILELKFKI